MIACIFVDIQNRVLVISEVGQCCAGVSDERYQITICPRFDHHQSNTDIMHSVYLNGYFCIFKSMYEFRHGPVLMKLHQAGKIDNLQRVCGVFGCV